MLHPKPKACYSFPFHVLCSQIAQAFVPSSSVYNHKIVPGMVTIKETIAIQYQQEKAVAIPENLILHHEGKKYLKFRPTAQPIISLLLGHGPKRNASCSQHEPLTQLIEARNLAIQEFQAEPLAEDRPIQDLFDQDPPAKKAKRSGQEPMSFTVTIQAGLSPVQVLCQGQRPSRADLAILVHPDHLEPVISHLRPGIATSLEVPTKVYKATK